MLLARRALYAFVELLLVYAFAWVMLRFDAENNWTQVWDGAQVGFMLLALPIALVNASFHTPPVAHLLGLRLQDASGEEQHAFARFARETLHFVVIWSPATLVPMFVLGIPGLNAIGKVAVGLGLLALVWLLSSLVMIKTRGRQSWPDRLTGSTMTLREVSRLPSESTGERGDVILPAALVLASVLILSVALAEWRLQAFQNFLGYSGRPTSLAPRIQSRIELVSRLDVLGIEHWYSAGAYWNSDNTAYLDGRAEHLKILVRHADLIDERRRDDLARSLSVAARLAAPSGTRWVEVALSSERQVGPLIEVTRYVVLIDLVSMTRRYAPSRQLHYFGSLAVSADSSLRMPGIADSVKTWYEAQRQQFLKPAFPSWQLGSLDVLRSKFVSARRWL